ncbi:MULTISPECIES: zinc-binding dehydrogenase [Bradyrhizobium]|uniref:zinc-binding dehydrogenase n=1 Tax=Bradyrhizobium TaxID=374 RepID=UPI00148E9104|nr:zinc-binding dehydrogenase [Bradyrhizobium diazoefficiens]QJS41107.1 zinc-binding dehydrogenase [Bradyrhizobium diazoefficiens]
MQAWQIERLGGASAFNDVPIPEVRAGSVLVRVEASALMSYLKDYAEGKLPVYDPPEGWFTPGGNAVGTVEAVGQDVWHVKPGVRVLISSHIVADERVDEPGQMLLGVTAPGPLAKPIQNDWRDGTLAEYVLVPKSIVTPVHELGSYAPAQLATLVRFAVPYGGLLRGRLAAGESLIVTGATGAYGGAAVLLAVALGAGRVVAAGRNPAKLDEITKVAGSRVVPIVLSGDVETDAANLRTAANGGAHMAFDMVGNARDPNATLAALRALRGQGRMVLMGSMASPLPISYMEVMMKGLEIIGQFMYPADSFLKLLTLVRNDQLDIRAIHTRAFPFRRLHDAAGAAATAGPLECIVVTPS